MATSESIVKAFAHGMIEALLASEPKEKAKKERPIVVQTDAINAAVRQYLDALAAQETQPEQQDLFAPQHVERGEEIYDRVQEARARVEARENPADEGHDAQPGTYRPDMPEGAPWQSPIP